MAEERMPQTKVSVHIVAARLPRLGEPEAKPEIARSPQRPTDTTAGALFSVFA
jgi:hypothetical protein